MKAFRSNRLSLRLMTRGPAIAALAVALLAGSAAVPVVAQDNTEGRLRKVEAEVRALQRKVFPGGDGTFFEPQITAPVASTSPAQTATSTPVTDLLTRMDAVEAQMARLTAQVEQNTNRLNELEQRLTAGLQPAITTPEEAPAPQDIPVPAVTNAVATVAPKPVAAAKPAPAAAKPAASAAPASSTRVAGVQAIEKPQTDDPADDEYTYGFRLWDAGYFPEARQQLQIYLEKYPNHRLVSFGRNLLGRAWLDDKNPLEASKWFLQNYQADKRGARAPDSLLYIAISMKQMNDTKRACIALAEFSETYASEAAGRLGTLYTSTRNGLNCS